MGDEDSGLAQYLQLREERPDLDGAVAGRGGYMAAHNLAVFYETLGQAGPAADYRALAEKLRG